jgi:tripartite-type tricarboxylate transporter receptor subunit TctC
MAEQGYPDWTLGSWSGVLAPLGTPKPVIDKLFAALTKTMNAPDVAERINAGGAAVFVSKSPVEFAQFLKAQTDLWAQTIKDIGATAE